MRFKFKGNVADKSIKTHTKCANLNVHRCKNPSKTRLITQNIFIVGGNKAVEGGTGGGGIGTEIFHINPFTDGEFGQHNFLANQVNAIASGTENLAFIHFFLITLVKGENNGCFVVKIDAVEGAIDAIIQIIDNGIFG